MAPRTSMPSDKCRTGPQCLGWCTLLRHRTDCAVRRIQIQLGGARIDEWSHRGIQRRLPGQSSGRRALVSLLARGRAVVSDCPVPRRIRTFRPVAHTKLYTWGYPCDSWAPGPLERVPNTECWGYSKSRGRGRLDSVAVGDGLGIFGQGIKGGKLTRQAFEFVLGLGRREPSAFADGNNR